MQSTATQRADHSTYQFQGSGCVSIRLTDPTTPKNSQQAQAEQGKESRCLGGHLARGGQKHRGQGEREPSIAAAAGSTYNCNLLAERNQEGSTDLNRLPFKQQAVGSVAVRHHHHQRLALLAAAAAAAAASAVCWGLAC